jgi:hypothetical protein
VLLRVKQKQTLPPLDSKNIMWRHFKQISDETRSDRYAVVIIDAAGWHTAVIDKEIENLSIIKLPL